MAWPSLSERGRFHLPVQAVFPMARAADAHTAAERGPHQGKIAVSAAR